LKADEKFKDEWIRVSGLVSIVDKDSKGKYFVGLSNL